MKKVVYSFYLVPTGKSGKLKPTTYRLSPEDAAKKFPGAQPYPHGSITIDAPETEEELMYCMYVRDRSQAR